MDVKNQFENGFSSRRTWWSSRKLGLSLHSTARNLNPFQSYIPILPEALLTLPTKCNSHNLNMFLPQLPSSLPPLLPILTTISEVVSAWTYNQFLDPGEVGPTGRVPWQPSLTKAKHQATTPWPGTKTENSGGVGLRELEGKPPSERAQGIFHGRQSSHRLHPGKGKKKEETRLVPLTDIP